MADATQTKKAPGSTKKKKDPPKVSKEPKPVREPIIPDLDAIAALPNCELWVKSGVKFDHPTFDVRSYTLLFVGDEPRKFCFNTYNGTLGKRGEPLPLVNFIENTPIKGTKDQCPWYAIKDLTKVHAKLEKDGYERVLN